MEEKLAVTIADKDTKELVVDPASFALYQALQDLISELKSLALALRSKK